MAHGDAGEVRRLALEPLTCDGFAPFGDVVRAGDRAGKETNFGTALRYDWLAKLESTRSGAKPNLAVFRATPQPLPLRVRTLERHPHSTQVFAALHAARWVVLVASDAADGGPDMDTARAFVAGSGDAVNYRRGLWHHPVIALDAPAELLMLAWEDGGAGDGEERSLRRPVLVG